MPRYALLISPSSNRVYTHEAPRLAMAELSVFGATVLDGRLGGFAELTLGGVTYVTFEADELTEPDIAHLSNMSAMFALFQLEGTLLRPLDLAKLDRFDDDLITIPKYVGKTNEQFTKLLLNVTTLVSGRNLLTDRPVVFDPLAGRGTTLNQALMYGYDALGVEVDAKDFEAYAGFLKTWLRRKKLKHRAEVTPVRRDKKLVAKRLEVTIGTTQRLVMYSTDTVKAREVIKPRSADVIVTDVPYGVAHGAHHKGLSRRPIDLLRAAIPGWQEILRPGGAIGISYNTYTVDREELTEVLESAGLAVRGVPGFAHRVDQAINRDILIAAN